MWTSPPWWRLPDPQGVPRWPSAHCLCRHSFISLSSRPGHTGVSLSEPLVPDVSGTRAASPAPVWAHSNCYRSAAATVTEGLVPRVLLAPPPRPVSAPTALPRSRGSPSEMSPGGAWSPAQGNSHGPPSSQNTAPIPAVSPGLTRVLPSVGYPYQHPAGPPCLERHR